MTDVVEQYDLLNFGAELVDECRDFLAQAVAEDDMPGDAAWSVDGREELALLLGEEGEGMYGLENLPLFEEMGQLSVGLTTGVLDESCNLHLHSKRSAGEMEYEVPTAKRQRLEDDEVLSTSTPGPLTLPVEVAPETTTPDYVNSAWVKSMIDALGALPKEDEEEWKRYLIEQFGALSGSCAPRTGPTRKVVLMERLLLALSHQHCQDTRLQAEPLRPLVEPELLAGEEGGVTRFLRPGRNFRVNDPLAFNSAFRALQACPLWPSTGNGTKGMTQPLSALGIGPVETAGAWTGRNSGVRGPEDTDPDKVWRDGRWVKKRAWSPFNGKWVAKGDRDGLYHRRYTFELHRVTKHAAHIFNTVPPALIKC